MKRSLLSAVLILMLAACSTPTESPPSPEIAPTQPPTNTAPPPQPTATPDPVLFVDEFESGLDPAWSWTNEDPQRWSLTEDGWLQIQAGNPGFAETEGAIRQVNLLTQPAHPGGFMITTRLFANPDENFQQAGIFMIHDGVNYVSILNAFCQPCLPDRDGSGFFLESFKEGEYIAGGLWDDRAPESTDTYLRLVYSPENQSISGYASDQPDQWQLIGVIEDFPSIQEIGLGAANAPSPEGVQEDLMAYFAYFEVSQMDTPVRTGNLLPKLPEPTTPPEPTATLEPTPLPQGVLFRDDFEGYLQPGWTWSNEDPDRWTFTEDGWLEIRGDNLAFYHLGDYGMTNFLTRELPAGDFMITAHVKSNPVENFQQATIYIYQDQNNYIALNTGFCSLCSTAGPGFYMETFIDNNPFSNAYLIPRDPADTDVYLRLVNQGGSLTGYYATTPNEWQRAGAFGNFFEFNSVGLGTTNSSPSGVENDIISQFDYFEIALPE